MDDFNLRTRRARLKEMILAGDWLYRGDPRRVAKIERLLEIAASANADLVGEWFSSLKRQRAIAEEIGKKTDVARQAEGLRAALDHVAYGVLILSSDGDLLFINEAMRRLVDRVAGMTIKNGRLCLTDDLAPVTRVMEAVARGAWVDGAVSLPFADDDIMAVRVFALDGPGLGGKGGIEVTAGEAAEEKQCLMILSEGRMLLDLSDRFARQFEFTPAEKSLLGRLVIGDDLREAAATLAIARNTARNQLSRIFEKTGVSRQSDLLRQVLQLPWL